MSVSPNGERAPIVRRLKDDGLGVGPSPWLDVPCADCPHDLHNHLHNWRPGTCAVKGYHPHNFRKLTKRLQFARWLQRHFDGKRR
jgi:hypothetical protein